MGSHHPGFITGLASEAKVLAPFVDAASMRVAGMGSAAAERAARELVAAGCDLLVSFGLAGGLAPTLPAGRIVVAESVVAPDGRTFIADEACTRALTSALPDAHAVRLAGSDTVISTVDDKVLLHRTGAAAVDMESHHVARCADDAGIRFAVVRAIADPHHAGIPAAAAHAVGPDGKPRIGAVLMGLAARPWDVVALVRLAGYARRAHASLGRVAPIVVGCVRGR